MLLSSVVLVGPVVLVGSVVPDEVSPALVLSLVVLVDGPVTVVAVSPSLTVARSLSTVQAVTPAASSAAASRRVKREQ